MSTLRERKPQEASKQKKSKEETDVPKPRPQGLDPAVLESLRTLGLAFVILGLIWFGTKYSPLLKAKFTPEPPSGETRTYLPGMRFGKLRPVDLPSALPKQLNIKADVEKRDAVREAFEWSWKSYEKCAWGQDELHPISCGGTNLSSVGSIGYLVVDTLDSLLIMDFKDEYKRAAKWCRDNLDFDRDGKFNTFETTIRVLGGLLAAHYLTSVSEDASIRADAPFYLERATDLGDRLLGAFNSPSGLPYSGINLHTREGVPDRDNHGLVSLAEAATLQLELKYLSHLTDDPIYWRKAERVSEVVRSQVNSEGIAPIFISPKTGTFVASDIRLGSRGDSYYEYLLKQYLQTSRMETVYRDMYDEAMAGIKKLLIGRSKERGLIYTQELHPERHPVTGEHTWRIVPKQDHLVCFLGGSFILGVTEGGNREELNWTSMDEKDTEDFLVGTGLVESCVDTYNTPTGLGAEIVMFVQPDDKIDGDWFIKPGTGLIDARNILRPETVESLFLAYRLTGSQKYRDWGWQIFQAFQKHCRVATGGYATIKDVRILPAEQEDRMETFWLSETLKYLYLLFDDGDHIPLDKHVFNTEAHILPVFEPASLTPFSTA